MSKKMKKIFACLILCAMLGSLCVTTYAAALPENVSGFVANGCTSHPKVANTTHYHFIVTNNSSVTVDSFTYYFRRMEGGMLGPYYQNLDILPGRSVTFYCNWNCNPAYAPWMYITNVKTK